MKDAKILEQNVKNSFHFVKDDILMLEEEHKQLLQRVAQLEKANAQLMALLTEEKRLRPKFIGNRQTRDLHKEDCILAQGSSPEHVTLFASRQQGRRQGFRDCVCLE